MTDEELFQVGIFDLCMALRMTRTGASDPMPDDERAAIHAYLRKREREWRPSTLAGEEAADACALAYLRAALAEDGA